MHHSKAPHLLEVDHLVKGENRVITYNDIPGTLEYKLDDVPLNEQSICPLGQRKLLFGEIQFLTKYLHLLDGYEKTVIYIGASPGFHIISLIKLFPTIKLILYDGRSFSKKLVTFLKSTRNNNVKRYKKLYTKKESAKYTDTPHLLISDIRNLSVGNVKLTKGMINPPEMNEKFSIIDNDLKIQKEIVLFSQPKACMLKFILSWNDKITKYLDGTIFMQNWTKRGSAETRLVCTQPYTFREYSNKEYELKLSYYNSVTRKLYYDYPQNIKNLLPLSGIPYVGHCHDCLTDLSIIADYLTNYSAPINKNIYDIFKLIDHNLIFMRKKWTNQLKQTFNWTYRQIN